MLVSGYFDDLPVERIPWFEAEVLRRIRQNHPDLLEEIKTTGHYQRVENRLRFTLREIKEELSGAEPHGEIG